MLFFLFVVTDNFLIPECKYSERMDIVIYTLQAQNASGSSLLVLIENHFDRLLLVIV